MSPHQECTGACVNNAGIGIGKGLTASYLSRPNTTAIAAVRDPESSSAKTLQDLPKGERSNLIVVKIDSSSPTDAKKAVSLLQSKHNIDALDIVIANAGICQIWPQVHEANIDHMREHLEVNVLGVVTLFGAVRPLLLRACTAASAAKFITMGSSAGALVKMEELPVPNGAYGPSKAALHWITKKIHLENPELITFPYNPGFVQSDMGMVGAKALGIDAPPLTVQQTVDGLLKLVRLECGMLVVHYG